MCSEDVKDWITLSMIPGVGGVIFKRLLDFFGSPKAVLNASLKQLNSVIGLTPLICDAIIEYRGKISIDKEMDLIQRNNCRIITIRDKSYPENLKAIYDPPPVIYVIGDILPEDSHAISVVGTRKASAYGKEAAEYISGQLASKGYTVISGMAYGIDTAAHKAALKSRGRTIAVMGNGVDIVYPERNAGLRKEIMASGAIVSEFSMGTPPLKANFPRRNRIVSGMSLGTLIVEAPERSGALITADCALEQGREVFAIPGQIFSQKSSGTHDLIKQGAKLVHSVQDIISELPPLESLKSKIQKTEEEIFEVNLTGDERIVWESIGSSPIYIDNISRQAKLPAYKVAAVLVMLELKGLVSQSAGKMFTRKSSVPD
ncbi:DNA-protecting protein DprA [Candidatus Poribacteria bacterium]|nr:DNA-protecting protein DprA [Candidatus Poribacteria bacterium]